MHRSFVSFIFTALLITLEVSGFSQTYVDIPYVKDGHEKQIMDIFVPEGVKAPRPVIMFIHGGGWSKGRKGPAMRHLRGLLEREQFVIADINYRLSGDSIFPAQIFDCKAAVRFLKIHADQYFIDTCRFGVMGTSAGAHLATLLGLSNGVHELEGRHLGNLEVSSRVYAIVDAFGPTDLIRFDSIFPDSCRRRNTQNKPHSASDQLLGCQPLECPDRARFASPIAYVDDSDIPVQIHHGDMDCVVPPLQSQLLYDTLLRHGVDAELYFYEGKGHGGFDERDFRGRLEAFFIEHLNDVQPPCEKITASTNPNIEELSIKARVQGGYLLLTSGEDLSGMKWSIIDLLGRPVNAGTILGFKGRIPISFLSPGYYTVFVQAGESGYTGYRRFYVE